MEMKPIKGFTDYFATPDGEIYSTKRKTLKKLKLASHEDGYLLACVVKDDGTSTRYRVHRLVALAYLDNPDGKKTVNHIDGDKTNNNVSNLEWMTNNENIRHAAEEGFLKGRDATRLTLDQREEIATRFANGEKILPLAVAFGVDRQTIKRWIIR